ncbi:MAG: translation elongation factor-like protein [Deltaproteobacteria bacterium]|nr:translation elongation factor-like protein [Deltaproteobacteria bacterium]
MKEEMVGVVRHYYSHLGVVGIILKGEMKVGDKIHIKGHTSDFTQKVDSMEIGHHRVESAKGGEDIGIKVAEHAREHDEVYKIVEEKDAA